ncbi:MAG: class I SAM-dependent methyltransferase [Candidatus Bathyarchaeota archaeon]|nr:class I SAM-dependent methyltransferase [Candidatus Bathyarchaeota archaeon]
MSGDRRPEEPNRRVPDWVRPTFWGDHPDSLAPYVPTPLSVVREMLALAGAGPGDVVYDLGCGDGRVLFLAVSEFNVSRAVGYDLDAEMVEALEGRIREEGLVGRVSAIHANFMEADLSPATIVTLYLTTSGNAKLRPKLEAELRPGARVVSHDFPVHGWVTDQPDGTPHAMGSHKMFLYRIPEAYTREVRVQRTDEEEDRWRRVRDMFTRAEKG